MCTTASTYTADLLTSSLLKPVHLYMFNMIVSAFEELSNLLPA
jgi:hypothetical protein